MARSPGDCYGWLPGLRAVDEALGSFTLVHSGGEDRRQEARSLVRGYLLPRLERPGAALVVAVVGGSGSGKSTLLNSLAGRRLVPSGPLRPTTTRPVVWSAEGVPPTVSGLVHLLGADDVRSDPAPPPGLALIDTPPPSILDGAGRPVAAALLECADACLFVASGIRYADAAGWALIRQAATRALPTLFVLNRLSGDPDIRALLAADFTRRLSAAGLVPGAGGEVVLGIGEGGVDPESGGLPPEAVAEVLGRLAVWGEPSVRQEVLGRVVAASATRLAGALAGLRSGLVDEGVARLALVDAVAGAYGSAALGITNDLEAGRFAPLADGPVGDLAAVAVRRCSRAARAAAAAWAAHPSGRRLLAGRVDLWAHGSETGEVAERLVDGWARSLPARAEAVCGRTRLRRARARREGEALCRVALDPAHRPEAGRVRRPGALVVAAAEARRGLAQALGEALEEDAGRFRALVGPPPPGRLLTRLRFEEER